ncbi:MAG: WbqC family protein [Thalassovita sp.]
MTGKTVAIMQPYFWPYLGYFGLMARADLFVILDCVQFPRRGRVHRSQLDATATRPMWMTLPLSRQARDVTIADLTFAGTAAKDWDLRLRKFQGFASLPDHVQQVLQIKGTSVAGYLCDQLVFLRDALGLDCAITRSSQLGCDPALSGQNRIVALARKAGAQTYLNAPGGRDLYDDSAFAAQDLALRFLPPYRGRHTSLLPALAERGWDGLRHDLARYAAEPLEGGNV